MPHTHTTAVTLNRTRWKLGQLGRQNPRVRRQQAYACRVRCREPALVNYPKLSPTVGWHCETTWAAIRGPKQNGAEPPAGKEQWSKGQSVKPRLQSWSRLFSVKTNRRARATLLFSSRLEPSARQATGVPGVLRYLSKDLPKSQRSSSKRKSYSFHYTLRTE